MCGSDLVLGLRTLAGLSVRSCTSLIMSDMSSSAKGVGFSCFCSFFGFILDYGYADFARISMVAATIDTMATIIVIRRPDLLLSVMLSLFFSDWFLRLKIKNLIKDFFACLITSALQFLCLLSSLSRSLCP